MNQKNFFLISFLPALAYWYLEEFYPVSLAVTGGVVLALLEILLEFVFTKHIHALSKFNFFLISGLGVISLLGNEGIWFKMQPAFSGWAIGFYMVFRLYRGRGLLVEMLESLPKPPPIPPFVLHTLEKHLIVFFGGYSTFMAFVAFFWTTNRWLFFKTIGLYIAFAFFALFEGLFMRRLMKKWLRRQRLREEFACWDRSRES